MQKIKLGKNVIKANWRKNHCIKVSVSFLNTKVWDKKLVSHLCWKKEKKIAIGEGAEFKHILYNSIFSKKLNVSGLLIYYQKPNISN